MIRCPLALRRIFPRAGAEIRYNRIVKLIARIEVPGIEGTVLLNVLVDEEGKVEDVSIIQSDVTGAMEKAAVEAAKGFFFKPAKQRTVPVKAHIAVPIRFKLHGN
jgi:TonB family protein